MGGALQETKVSPGCPLDLNSASRARVRLLSPQFVGSHPAGSGDISDRPAARDGCAWRVGTEVLHEAATLAEGTRHTNR